MRVSARTAALPPRYRTIRRRQFYHSGPRPDAPLRGPRRTVAKRARRLRQALLPASDLGDLRRRSPRARPAPRPHTSGRCDGASASMTPPMSLSASIAKTAKRVLEEAHVAQALGERARGVRVVARRRARSTGGRERPAGGPRGARWPGRASPRPARPASGSATSSRAASALGCVLELPRGRAAPGIGSARFAPSRADEVPLPLAGPRSGNRGRGPAASRRSPRACSTRRVGRIDVAEDRGRSARKMPAFSKPMDSRSLPRKAWWSRSTLATIAQSGIDDVHGIEAPAEADFEDHRLEPRIARRSREAASVPNSKYVSGVSPRAASTRSKRRPGASSVASSPWMRTRSL